MQRVHHGSDFGIQPDRCVFPGLVSMISTSWAAAGVQSLRSPPDQSLGVEVVSRGRHTVSQQGCLRRPLLAEAWFRFACAAVFVSPLLR